MRILCRSKLLLAIITGLTPFAACSHDPLSEPVSSSCIGNTACPAGQTCSNGVCMTAQAGGGGSGGSPASGPGGSQARGGSPATGGSASLGGQAAGGGAGGTVLGSGGATSNGGAPGSSGTFSTGGLPGSGGGLGLGGKGGSGGALSFGGNLAKGGSTGSGGTAKGGSTGSGGTGKGGSSQGGSAQGGSSGGMTSTTCNITGSPSPGSASFTWYELNQGTCQNFGCQTACGYQGNTGNEIRNIAATQYFAAIPAPTASNFTTSRYCGACAEVTNPANGRTLVVTIVDMCPQDSNAPCRSNPSSHLDLSRPAFDQLGFTRGDPMGTTWRFVPCAVTGNVVIRVKSGNSNEIYIENEIVPIASVTLNGQQAVRQSYGAWHFDQDIPQGATLNLTDMAGRTLTVTVSSITQNQNQDTGRQFPRCN